MIAQAVPDFLCIGAQRSGTSWLYAQLCQQAGIWLPPLKELHYFDTVDPTVHESSRRYGAHLKSRVKRYAAAASLAPLWTNVRWVDIDVAPKWDFRFFVGPATDSWYVSLFADAKKRGRIVGEITPAYSMLSVDMIKRVSALNPNMKIILLLRDPIERSWSQATKELCKKDSDLMGSVSEDRIMEFIRSEDCVRRSDYVTTLNNWRAIFRPEQIHVGFLEDIKTQPRELLKNITEFLGLYFDDTALGDDIGQARNSTQGKRNSIPPGVQIELARIYEPMLKKLRQHYGSKTASWHDRARSLLADV